MVAVKYYDVRIGSSDGEMMLEINETDNKATFMFDHVDNHSIIKINITVIDINGQRSNSSVVERSISDVTISIASKYI